MRRSQLSFVLVLCIACLAQSPSNVQVNLSLAGEKTVYKIGEPILLRLAFSASVGTSLNMTTTDPASPVDRLVVSPMKGVFPWLEDQDRGHPYLPDYAAIARIEPGKIADCRVCLSMPSTASMPRDTIQFTW